jgi:hypothetical protein
MRTRGTGNGLSALGVAALMGIATVVWSGSALAQSGSLQRFLARGVVKNTGLSLGNDCPKVTCPTAGACDSVSFTGPVALNVGGVTTNATVAGCMELDGSTGNSNGNLSCFGASGGIIITKASTNQYSATMGGQWCEDNITTASFFSSFHTGYTVTGGTGSLSGATGVGDFNLDFNNPIATPFAAGNSDLDMNGNIIP